MNIVPELALKVTLFKSHRKNKSDERKFMSRGVVSFNNLPVTAKKPLPASLSIFKQNVS